MGLFGYYDNGLLQQHDNEEKRRNSLRRDVLEKWKVTSKSIKEEEDSLLQREARHEALLIIEESARTEEEYDKVTILWDCIGMIEGWRVAKQETRSMDSLIEYKLKPADTIIPPPLEHEWWRNLLNGKFIDLIYDCPHEISELTSSVQIHDLTKKLDEKQKEILYYLAIRQWTPQRLAVMRGQTDRNIRKVYNKMIEDMQHKIYERLYPRYVQYWNLTTSQVAFIERYIQHCGDDVGKIRADLPEKEKSKLRRIEYEQPVSEN